MCGNNTEPYIGTGLPFDNNKIVENKVETASHAQINFCLNAGIEAKLFKAVVLRAGYTYSLTAYISGGIGFSF